MKQGRHDDAATDDRNERRHQAHCGGRVFTPGAMPPGPDRYRDRGDHTEPGQCNDQPKAAEAPLHMTNDTPVRPLQDRAVLPILLRRVS